MPHPRIVWGASLGISNFFVDVARVNFGVRSQTISLVGKMDLHRNSTKDHR